MRSFKTLKKGIAIRKKETAAMLKAAGEPPASTTTTTTADAAAAAPAVRTTPVEKEIVGDDKANAAAAGSDDALEAKDVNGVEAVGVEVTVEEGGKARRTSTELQAILDDDAKQYPLWAWSLLAPMTLFTVVYAIIKKQIKDSEGCVEAGYWLWYLTPLPVLGGFMLRTAYLLKNRHLRKVAAGFEYLAADMQWDTETLKRFPATAILAGVTAGLLGIGGGMVIGPLFLSIGMEPQVGTSSCAFMILWTAFSGVVIYGLDDHLGAELAIWCVAFGFISGQIGQRLVNAVLKKTGRPSYVVFLLGSIIGAACLAMATTLVIKMVTGDYDANDTIEENETISTHLFYLGSGLGCKSSDDYHNSSYAH